MRTHNLFLSALILLFSCETDLDIGPSKGQITVGVAPRGIQLEGNINNGRTAITWDHLLDDSQNCLVTFYNLNDPGDSALYLTSYQDISTVTHTLFVGNEYNVYIRPNTEVFDTRYLYYEGESGPFTAYPSQTTVPVDVSTRQYLIMMSTDIVEDNKFDFNFDIYDDNNSKLAHIYRLVTNISQGYVYVYQKVYKNTENAKVTYIRSFNKKERIVSFVNQPVVGGIYQIVEPEPEETTLGILPGLNGSFENVENVGD